MQSAQHHQRICARDHGSFSLSKFFIWNKKETRVVAQRDPLGGDIAGLCPTLFRGRPARLVSAHAALSHSSQLAYAPLYITLSCLKRAGLSRKVRNAGQRDAQLNPPTCKPHPAGGWTEGRAALLALGETSKGRKRRPAVVPVGVDFFKCTYF